MILVLCLNPAIDKTCVLKSFALGRMHRPGSVLALPGGKGVNVARVLGRLGERPLLLGFTAGYTGRFIEAETRKAGMEAAWVRLASGSSRTCLAVLDGGCAPTELNEPGPAVGAADMRRLVAAYGRLLGRARLVIMSGSLPPGCPRDAYGRLIRLARARGRPAYLDTSMHALAPGVAAGPDLVKLNLEEAASLGFNLMGSGAQAALGRLRRRGAKDAVVTMGRLGAVASIGGRLLRASPPPVASLQPVGCGDTFMAGLAHMLLRGAGPERSLAFATALATASTRVLGAGVFRARDIPRVLGRVRVGPL